MDNFSNRFVPDDPDNKTITLVSDSNENVLTKVDGVSTLPHDDSSEFFCWITVSSGSEI